MRIGGTSLMIASHVLATMKKTHGFPSSERDGFSTRNYLRILLIPLLFSTCFFIFLFFIYIIVDI